MEEELLKAKVKLQHVKMKGDKALFDGFKHAANVLHAANQHPLLFPKRPSPPGSGLPPLKATRFSEAHLWRKKSMASADLALLPGFPKFWTFLLLLPAVLSGFSSFARDLPLESPGGKDLTV